MAAASAAENVHVSLSELRELCTKALRVIGYSVAEVPVLLEVLMHAQLRDNNQGIVKITSGGLNRAPNAGPPIIEQETNLSAVINGNNGSGMLVLNQAIEMAATRATKHGFGIVGTNHTSSSTGAIGYYSEMLAKRGLIGIVLAQSPEFVAPHGAKKAVFGTNPIAISIPADDGPVTMDMATAAFAWFGVLEAKAAGKPVPEGIAINADGHDTTDPDEVLSGGAIKVFDKSYKGSNLALMVELLAGPLVGAAVSDKLAEKNWGNLVLALDPSLLGNKDVIQQRMQMVLDRVKNAERQPGVSEIMLPGERGSKLAASRVAAGMLPIEPNMLQSLRIMAAKFDAPPAAPGVPPAASRNGDTWEAFGVATKMVQPRTSVVDPYLASGPPLWQTATFAQPTSTTNGEYDYTRSGNPTRDMFQEQMCALEGGDRSLAFTSGMAALAAVSKLAGTGEHIVAGEDIYGGTSRLLSMVVPSQGVTVSNVDMTDVDNVRKAIIPGKTKVVFIESPTNPRMQICDIRAICDLARDAGAVTCVDNSIMTLTFQRPLDLGADISMTSGTKFIGGHADVTLGTLTVKGDELAKKLYFFQNAEGAGLAPFDCWLAMRGLKTMALRMERAAENCAKLAMYLSSHPLVTKINYAGLGSHPGADTHARQATSGGSLLSFTTGDVELSKIIVEETKLFKVTVSFGSVNSLISLPCYMSHASIPAEVRAARGLPDDLVRISCGIESVDDLLADLDQALSKAMATKGMAPTPVAVPAGATPGEQQLLQRVRQLEEQVRQLSSSSNGSS